MNFKKMYKFAIKNYFISIFIAIIIFVGFVSIFKLFFSKPTYVYAKVKVGQGMWWANTVKPSMWLVEGIKKKEKQTDLLGDIIAEILEVRYYPLGGSDQFDVYLTLKLKVTKNKKTGAFIFNRSALGVASPISLEFPSIQVSGTVIDLNEKQFEDKYIEKKISLIKRNGYNKNSSAIYDNIIIGDEYFDGIDTVFTILDKSLNKNIINVYDLEAQVYEREIDTRQNISVKAKIKLKKKGGRLFYGEDYLIKPGRTLNIATSNYVFSDYVVEGIE